MSIRTVGLMLNLVLIAYAAFRLWKALNSPDGERYLKRRMQGPFVPLTSEEIADDEARKLHQHGSALGRKGGQHSQPAKRLGGGRSLPFEAQRLEREKWTGARPG